MTKQEFIQWLDGYFTGLEGNPPDAEKIRAKANQIEEKETTITSLPRSTPWYTTRLPWETDSIWCGTSTVTATDPHYGLGTFTS